jgi:peptide/nickel transport system permease protein
VLDSEYVKMARAKGVSRKWVLWKHALRNAMISPLTVAGLTLGSLITGSVLIEVVFAWPGLGTLSLSSVFNADFTTVQGVFLVVTLFYVTTSFLVDILYALVDPRIRFS